MLLWLEMDPSSGDHQSREDKDLQSDLEVAIEASAVTQVIWGIYSLNVCPTLSSFFTKQMKFAASVDMHKSKVISSC